MTWTRTLSPCLRCKGPKGETRQGARLCSSCFELREKEKEARTRQTVRANDWLNWLGVRKQVVDMWLRGYSATQMGEEITMIAHGNHKGVSLSESTVRGYFQRIYNEYGLTAGRRTPAAAVHEAVRRGDIPCPCPSHAESDPGTPDELVAQLEREIRKYRRRQPAHAAPSPVKPKPPTETYLDRINRIRGGPGKV